MFKDQAEMVWTCSGPETVTIYMRPGELEMELPGSRFRRFMVSVEEDVKMVGVTAEKERNK